MGSAYDLDKIEYNPRCRDVKEAVIILSYIGIFFSSLTLIFGIYKMLLKKGRLSFFTRIILFIFFSEILNMVSRCLQFLKYAFEDTRGKKDKNDVETPRGIICQIQIVFSIISDFCSLLGTLLLSIRCVEVIKSKKRIFDRKKVRVLSFCFIILLASIMALLFLFIDRYLTKDYWSIKFDIRDRCSYWCWLEHDTSRYCYILYVIILIVNIVYACKSNYYLQKGYKKLLEQSVVLIENNDSPGNENNNSEVEEKRYISFDDRRRVDEIRMMRIKCIIYPIITIIIWSLSSLYRFIDDFIMRDVDVYHTFEESWNGEEEYWKNKEGLRIFQEVNLILHTILSAFRGVLYGFSFMMFEEKVFGNFFRNYIYKCCYKEEEFEDLEETDTGNSRTSDRGILTPFSSGRVSHEGDQNIRQTSTGEYVKNNEMNSSDYHYND